MWKELFQVLSDNNPVEPMTQELMQMLEITKEMSSLVHEHVFDQDFGVDQRAAIYKLDIKVNKLERSIRKRVITHLSISHDHVSYCLLLMSLIKDAERVGDYLKNISEVPELGGAQIPDGPLKTELQEIIDLAVEMLKTTPDILATEDTERATDLLQVGRNTGKRCDVLLVELAKSDLTAAQTTSMVLLTRFHKRLGAHLLNILSSVVMPLHKIDFYDGRISEDPSTN
ncbi:MAG: hypothetical protein HOI23_12620 [Deltaproteobacteria bacterium]|jgi:phosphate transport system protein|nr:hypothetical protein [Deltaproteobacteria bacterium]MBT6431455.1 hypothetical protein [Deltaproteobacteria bacterium]